jgi:hypothetical protein
MIKRSLGKSSFDVGGANLTGKRAGRLSADAGAIIAIWEG